MDTPAPPPGLCAGCEHARVIRGARTIFWMCRRAESEPRLYPRYPRLPVTACTGFDAGSPEQRSVDGG